MTSLNSDESALQAASLALGQKYGKQAPQSLRFASVELRKSKGKLRSQVDNETVGALLTALLGLAVVVALWLL